MGVWERHVGMGNAAGRADTGGAGCVSRVCGENTIYVVNRDGCLWEIVTSESRRIACSGFRFLGRLAAAASGGTTVLYCIHH